MKLNLGLKYISVVASLFFTSFLNANILYNPSFEQNLDKWYSKKGQSVCDSSAYDGKCYFSSKGAKGTLLSQDWYYPADGRFLMKIYIKGEVGQTVYIELAKKCFTDYWQKKRKKIILNSEWTAELMYSFASVGCDGIRLKLYAEDKVEVNVDHVRLYKFDF